MFEVLLNCTVVYCAGYLRHFGQGVFKESVPAAWHLDPHRLMELKVFRSLFYLIPGQMELLEIAGVL